MGCPQIRYQPKCSMLGSGLDNSDDKMFMYNPRNATGLTDCKVVEVDEYKTVCECNICQASATTERDGNGRRLDVLSGDMGMVEVVAMSEYVLNDLADIVETLDDFSDPQKWLDAVYVVVFFGVVWIGCFGVLVFGQDLIFGSKAAIDNSRSKRSLLKTLNNDDMAERDRKVIPIINRPILNRKYSIPGYNPNKIYDMKRDSSTIGSWEANLDHRMYDFIMSFFPGAFSDDTGDRRISREIKASVHVMDIFQKETLYERFLVALYIVSTITVSSFLLAFLFALQYPSDDGFCDAQPSEEHCLSKKSVFDSESNLCTWNSAQTGMVDGYCEYKELDTNPSVMFLVIIIVAAINGPTYGALNIIFERIMFAPTVEEVDETKRTNVSLTKFVLVTGNSGSSSAKLSSQHSRRGGVMDNNNRTTEKDWSFVKVLSNADSSGDDAKNQDDIYLNSGRKYNRRSLDESIRKTKVLDTTVKLPPEFSQAARIAITAGIQRNGVDIRAQLIAVHRTQQQLYADMKSNQQNSAVVNGRRAIMGVKNSLATNRMSRAFGLGDTVNLSETMKLRQQIKQANTISDPNAVFDSLVLDFETRAQAFRRTLTADQKAIFDRHWGLTHCFGKEGMGIVRRLSNAIGLHQTAPDSTAQTISTNNDNSYESGKNASELASSSIIIEGSGGSDPEAGTISSRSVFRKNLKLMKEREAAFIGSRMASAITQASTIITQLKDEPDYIEGAEIIRLFAADIIGSNTLHGQVFSSKYNSEFEVMYAVSMPMKICLTVIILAINIFLIFICIGYAAKKGYGYQKSWLIACAFKVFFDVIFKRLMEGIVVDFALPSLLNDDIDEVKKILKHSGKRLLSGGSSYRFDLFSATDYTYVSSFVAKEFPHLVESKLVLMHRDPLPERLYQRRHMYARSSRRSRMPWWDVLSASLLTVVLYFAAMPHDIQRAFVHVFPAIIFVVLGFGMTVSNPIVFVFSLIFASVSLGIFCKFIYSIMKESPADRRRNRSLRLSQNAMAKPEVKRDHNTSANRVQPSADDSGLHLDDDEFLISYPDTSSDEGGSSDDLSTNDFSDDENSSNDNNVYTTHNINSNDTVEASSEEDNVVSEIRATDEVLNHGNAMRATTTNTDNSRTFKPYQEKNQNQLVTEQPRKHDHRRPSLDVDEEELPEEERVVVASSLAKINGDSFDLSSSDSDFDNSDGVVVLQRRAKRVRNRRRSGGIRALRNIRSGRRGSGLNKGKITK